MGKQYIDTEITWYKEATLGNGIKTERDGKILSGKVDW